MKETPYSRFRGGDLILRDELALDRTLLANERTLLAYLRSAAALLIAGFSIIHFSAQDWFWTIGILCLPAGIIIGLIGAVRYKRRSLSISVVRKRLETEARQEKKNDRS
jgi:putative membrane protein